MDALAFRPASPVVAAGDGPAGEAESHRTPARTPIFPPSAHCRVPPDRIESAQAVPTCDRGAA